MRNRFFSFFLWWAVIGFSTWVGGTIFMMTVMNPVWSSSPPQSLKDFASMNFDLFNFFGPRWMLARYAPVFLALFLGWNSKLHRRYLLLASATIVIGLSFTLFYIYPINDILFTKAGAGQSIEQVHRLVETWLLADRLRFVVMLVGYFSLLMAFRSPNPVPQG